MLLLALCNVLLGSICGLWFRVSILVPLVAVAFIEEVVIPKHSPTWSSAFWWSAFWSVLLLVATLEVGYLIGVSMNALGRSLARVRVLLRDLLRSARSAGSNAQYEPGCSGSIPKRQKLPTAHARRDAGCNLSRTTFPRLSWYSSLCSHPLQLWVASP
jgi:hypothetical protein